MSQFCLSHFDPLSKEFSEDPYIIYKALRARDKPFYFENQNIWLLSRYDDVAAIATNPDMVRSMDGFESIEDARSRQRRANWHDMPYHERVVQFSLLDSDGDIHRRLRKQIFGHFTARSVLALETVVESFVTEMVHGFKDRDKIEFIEDFAAHIPGFVIGHLLGVAEEHCVQLRLWSEQIVQFFDIDRSEKRKKIAETASHEFYEFLTELKTERIKRPRDDLISKMIIDEKNGLYSDDEFISTCMLILMAGHGSTIDVLGSGMHTLLKNPDALQTMRKNKNIIPNAIQEMFRYEPPLPFFHRHASRKVRICGQTFAKGTTFGLLYGAANRDPLIFEDPDIFNINRNPNRHLAFGLGAHLCLGNHIARQNMKIIFATLLREFKDFELIDDYVAYKRGLSIRGVRALNIGLVR